MAKKKILVLFLVFSILLSPLVDSKAAPSTGQDAKKNAENQLKENQDNLKTAQDKVNQLEREIQRLDGEIGRTLTELEDNKAKILKSENEVKKAEKAVELATEEIKEQQQLLDKRVRVLYKSGVAGYLDLILSSESFTDLVDKYQKVARVVKFDKQVVEQMEEKRVNLQEKKDLLQVENQRLLELKAEKESKLSKLNESKKEQSKLVDEARAQEKLLGEKVQVSKKEVDRLQYILNMVAVATNESKSIKEIQNAVTYLKSLNSNEGYINDAIALGNTIVEKKQKPPTTNNGGNGSGGSTGTVKPSGNAMKVVLYSMQFQGVPYVWGGETPAGFDCSGFVKYCYAKAAGVYLTRTTYTQINEGTPVDRANLRPGDLVFFGTWADPNHVGLYIGDGNYIHAPRTGDKVRIASLQGKNYLTARRIIP